jgi:hypothetical protein
MTSTSLSSLQRPAQISCILYSVNLITRPPFVALSYMWGTDSATKEILINSKCFLVRQNLWDFLVRMQQAEMRYRVPLWIDAICIDQSEITERNHQVSLMGEIYTNARLVISWLGLSDGRYRQGLEWCEQLWSLRHRNSQAWPHTTIQRYDIIRLYDDEYWSRTWIIQEVVLPPDVEIWIGARRINHRVLNWIAETLPGNFRGLGSRNGIMQTPAMLLMTRRAFHHNQRNTVHSSLHKPHGDLLNLLEISKASFCIDVRDRVFAILSLIDPEQRADLNIVPDYNMTALQLCRTIDRKVQRYILQHQLEPYVEYLHLLHQVLDISDDEDVRPLWQITNLQSERQVKLLPRYPSTQGDAHGAIGDKRTNPTHGRRDEQRGFILAVGAIPSNPRRWRGEV